MRYTCYITLFPHLSMEKILILWNGGGGEPGVPRAPEVKIARTREGLGVAARRRRASTPSHVALEGAWGNRGFPSSCPGEGLGGRSLPGKSYFYSGVVGRSRK